MCGIAGILGDIDAQIAERAVGRMLHVQTHRGPDSGGLELLESRGAAVCLGNRRLAIIDTTDAGRQPIVDEHTGNVLVYNGEIYNFAQLRRELETSGVRFRGRSDTEVLLLGYGRWGIAVVERLVGMFAFAVWDANQATLVLGRDRLGIKPLYYAYSSGVFVFASEVRALLESDLVERRIDPRGVESYLAYGAVQGPLTVVQGVRSLPPAHWMSVVPGREPEQRRYWTIPFSPACEQTSQGDERISRITDLLFNAVRRQLVSDVPLGIFLSGGVDSSSIAAIASAEGSTPRTFSITFGEKEYAEGAFAKEVAHKLGTDHSEVEFSERDLLEVLPEALSALDMPTHDGFNVFVVSRAARDAGITVALSGQGGDELFGGYATFSEIPLRARRNFLTNLLRDPAKCAMSLGAHINARLASSLRLRLLAGSGDAFDLYRIWRSVFGPALRQRLLEFRTSDLVDGIPASVAAALDEALPPLRAVDRVSLLELSLYLGNTLLRDGDFMSMSNSIEVRVPLLDDELVALVASIPGDRKMDASMPKPLLVRAVGDRLPSESYTRPKQGFTFPWNRWLLSELRDPVSAMLDDPRAGEGIGLRRGACCDMWRSFTEGRRVTTWTMVWSLFVLLRWCEAHRVTL